jgi:copper chaperone NosL
MTRALTALLVLPFGAALVVFLLGGSSRGERAGPRPVRLGEDPCAECLMLANDGHFAAERVLGPDEVKVYDDPGCLLREMAKDRTGAAFFADADTGEWLDAATVRFVTSKRDTPMGYGLAATRAERAGTNSLDLEGAIRRVAGSAKEKN